MSCENWLACVESIMLHYTHLLGAHSAMRLIQMVHSIDCLPERCLVSQLCHKCVKYLEILGQCQHWLHMCPRSSNEFPTKCQIDQSETQIPANLYTYRFWCDGAINELLQNCCFAHTFHSTNHNFGYFRWFWR